MNRRDFLRNTGFAIGGTTLIANQALASFFQTSAVAGPPIGAITYSFRSMESDLDSVIAYCKTCGMNAIELMGDPIESFAGAPENPIDFRKVFANGRRPFTDEERSQMEQYRNDLSNWRTTVSMAPFKKAAKKLKKAGITVYAFKPSTFGENNTDAEIEYGMKVAKILGSPSVTVELPRNSEQSARLGKFGEKHGVFVGYHAHLQATDTLWDEALAQSPYNTLNLDCGHYIAAGGDNTTESLLRLIEKHHDRISSMHLKDRKNKENGGDNVAWGTGDTPICEVLNLLKDKGYNIPVSVELEYPIPDGSDAVQEVKKCVDYAKACLS
ncbi:sugar phosphate isomerase/epimerase family protein [Jiulongibacter sediminis]|uniref:Xylose isomerase n=1 Tax=Jiulongibacter sediminis TaxID=1605367 RepID=A0A0P7C9Z4_9BACT|nr:sugar phosphate isomerase/epimerase [Jiulongibacter sediminis]KPM49391.1 xylose isomerase [Jiulongibacter sediminis]TBX26440.1 xylose isomerase [Jiulongibacter sediminis]